MRLDENRKDSKSAFRMLDPSPPFLMKYRRTDGSVALL